MSKKTLLRVTETNEIFLIIRGLRKLRDQYTEELRKHQQYSEEYGENIWEDVVTEIYKERLDDIVKILERLPD